MATNAFRIDRREIEFVLFEHLKVDSLFRAEKFQDHSAETFNEMLSTAIKMSRETLGPLNRVGDKVGCHLDIQTKKVSTPPGTAEAYREYVQNGFLGMGFEMEHGGIQLPAILNAALLEVFTGAAPAFSMYPGLTRAACHLIMTHGADWMKETVTPKILDASWTGTMCLTEPSVGSAVGDLRTTATRHADGTYRIKGTKQWISGGDNDFASNVMHLVLARIEGAPAGIKGVSLFLVPKHRFDTKTGAILGSNDVQCISLEEKMGIHGNSTCLMQFGDADNSMGWLIGEEHRGIDYMFLMMNEARIGVGLQALSMSNLAFLNAEHYATERIQGVDVEHMRDVSAPRVPIIKHPDVQRMLLRQRATVEAIRALVYTTCMLFDESEVHEDSEVRTSNRNLCELLTPIVKAWSTDVGFNSIVTSIQTYGGYGFTREYPVEQYLRDMKITSIYEGTNGIQALDLLGRKLKLQDGFVLMNWLERFTSLIDAHRDNPQLGKEMALVEESIATLMEAIVSIDTLAKSNRRGAILNAYPLLMGLGYITGAGLLLEQAVTCQRWLQENASAPDSKASFYRNKIRTAKFFVHNMLPEGLGQLQVVKSCDLSCMEFEWN